MQAAQPFLSDRDHRREQVALEAFTKKRSAPNATFALFLVAIAAASISLSMDEVERYSPAGFLAGIGLAGACAIAIGYAIDAVEDAALKTFVTVFLPTGAGAMIGVMVQAFVLAYAGTGWQHAVKDLGGLIDTTQPVPWLMGGLVLGGTPALLVTVFLLLASRTLKRLSGHDASEGFGVAFVGAAGVIAAVGLFLVKGMAMAPLFLVTVASAITVLVAILIDGSRIGFLRSVYARTGSGEGFDVVPASRFASDPALAPMVANAGGTAVLVRLAKGEYRAAAMTPIALVADSEEATIRPLLVRRRAAALVLVGTAILTALAMLLHT